MTTGHEFRVQNQPPLNTERKLNIKTKSTLNNLPQARQILIEGEIFVSYSFCITLTSIS
jgi:hypothetical protein